MVDVRWHCTNNECNLAVDGKCIEGLARDECPHAKGLSLDDVEEAEERFSSDLASDPAVQLDLGDHLDRRATSNLQRRRQSRVIGLIGPNDSGKTSLIAGLYDLFQRGPIGEVSFAGSSTLVGFERICHLARAASRRTVPHAQRTTVGADATFFHFDIQREGSPLLSLFIGDRSGEDYLGAMDELSRADEFFELRRADCITILVNGEQLADNEKRHETRATTPQIVDALLEANALRRGSRLALVLTKLDAVLSSPNEARINRDFAAMADQIRGQHSDDLGAVGTFSVAASPKDCNKVQRGAGLEDLLLFWLAASPVPTADFFPSRRQMSRMIDRFGCHDGGIP